MFGLHACNATYIFTRSQHHTPTAQHRDENISCSQTIERSLGIKLLHDHHATQSYKEAQHIECGYWTKGEVEQTHVFEEQ